MSVGEFSATPPESIVVESVSDTVKLMQLTAADAQAYYDLIVYDPDHLRQFRDVTADKYPDVSSVRESIEHPRNPDKLRFGIWDSGVMVGSINLTPEDDDRAEIGYWVGKQHAGHGYAVRSTDLLVGYAFSSLGLSEVYANIVVGNEASRKSVEKSGFVLVHEFVNEEGVREWQYKRTKEST